MKKFFYDGTPSSGDAAVEFALDINPHNCAGGRIELLGVVLWPGDTLLRDDDDSLSVERGTRH